MRWPRGVWCPVLAALGIAVALTACSVVLVWDKVEDPPPAGCGDGVVEGEEECDDGNTDAGDGCSSLCQNEFECGNGQVEVGEECDDGNLNSDTIADACRTNCRSPRCGDGITDTGEECDDGNQTGNDACLPTCVRNVCGDSVVDPATEECDDGNQIDWDGCNSCQIREFRVNSYTTDAQTAPRVDAASDGRFVVVWRSNFQDGDGGGVYGQRFGVDGVRVGPEMPLNTITTATQTGVKVAMAPNGSFVAAWFGAGGSDLKFRIFDVNGTPAGPEQPGTVATGTAEAHSDICIADDGTFAIPFESWGGDGDGYGAFVRWFGPDGTPLTGDVQVNTTTVGSQLGVDCAFASDGRMVVSWWHSAPGPVAEGFAQRYGTDRNPVGGEFQINTETADIQAPMDTAATPDGRFLIVWTSNLQDGDLRGIYGQRFDAAGTPVGVEFRANNWTVGEQRWAKASLADDGRFVIVWASQGQDGDGEGIFAKLYHADGTVNVDEFRVNVFTALDQDAPDVAMTGDGQFVIVWEDAGLDGDGYGILAQKYDAEGNPLGAGPWAP